MNDFDRNFLEMGKDEKKAARDELEKMQQELTKLSVKQEQIQKEEE